MFTGSFNTSPLDPLFENGEGKPFKKYLYYLFYVRSWEHQLFEHATARRLDAANHKPERP